MRTFQEKRENPLFFFYGFMYSRLDRIMEAVCSKIIRE